MSDGYFKQEWIIPYKPTLWCRFILWLFGKPYIATGMAREGETVVKWKLLNGKMYIQGIYTNDQR